MIRLSADRDILILNFLWKWKVATTAAIACRFFPLAKLETAYKRLLFLENAGFIETQADRHGSKYVWMLCQKGYTLIRDMLPESVEKGFRSEAICHDLVSAALHLGPWLPGEPHGVELFSEQQLRRYSPDDYLDWVPKNLLHRPDGYTRVRDDHVLAFEVEFSQKSPTDYEIIADRYAQTEAIKHILWLVGDPSLMKRIHASIVKGIRDIPHIHNFVSYGQFVRHGWQSKIEIGQKQGQSISFLMNFPHATTRQPVEEQLLLNARKTPHKSKASALVAPGDFRDRLGYSPNLSNSYSKESILSHV